MNNWSIVTKAALAVAVLAMAWAGPAMAGTVWYDYDAWLNAIGAQAGRIDWDDIALAEGEHTTISADRYSHLVGSPMLAADNGSGLFVGNPDTGKDNNTGFFGQDFFPVSQNNVFSPDLTGSPEGILTITFDQPISAIGAWFLDVEEDWAHTGIEVNGVMYNFGRSQGDNAQSFLGVTGVGPFTQARIHMSSQAGLNGVGLDDIIYAVPLPAAAWAGMALMGAMGGWAGIKRKMRRD